MMRVPLRGLHATAWLVCAATVVLTAEAAAQRPHRSGLWVEFGSGPAHARVGCSGCEDVTRGSGSAGYLRIGGVLSDRVLLGVESFSLIDHAFGFAADDRSIVAENASVAAIVVWYPWRSGFFFKGGVGLAGGEFTVEPDSEAPIVSEGVGVGLTFGMGLDVPISRRFALTGSAGTWITAIGDVVLPTAIVDDVIATLYAVTIGFTIR